MKIDKRKIEKVIELIEGAKVILLFPHSNMDGDALGSSVALAIALRSIGKEASVFVDEEVPDNIAFLDHGLTTRTAPKQIDLAVLIDAGEVRRLEGRKSVFNSAANTLCIDHHKTSTEECEINLLDQSAAATAELVYDLLISLKIPLNKEIAEALYTGIDTDTGRFQYSNTHKRTHEIVADLYDYGIDQNKVAVEIYQSDRYEKIKLRNEILSSAELFADGKAVVAIMTQDMIRKTGAKESESEGAVEELRNIKGVEVAVLVKETCKDNLKISMRSKEKVDVAEIAASFGGGGHVRAAGFSTNMNINKLNDVLKQKIVEVL